MAWVETLLGPLLDRIALKLAIKVRAQLNGAVDAALDRAEDRIDQAFEGLEGRLMAAANKAVAPIADELKTALAPVLKLQGQVLEAEKLRSEVWAQAARIQQQAAAAKPVLELQQQVQVAAAAVGLTPDQAAEAAGMVPLEAVKDQIHSAAVLAAMAGRDYFRSRLRAPHSPLERPDR